MRTKERNKTLATSNLVLLLLRLLRRKLRRILCFECLEKKITHYNLLVRWFHAVFIAKTNEKITPIDTKQNGKRNTFWLYAKCWWKWFYARYLCGYFLCIAITINQLEMLCFAVFFPKEVFAIIQISIQNMQSTEMPANLRFVNSNALFSNSIDRQFSVSLPHTTSITLLNNYYWILDWFARAKLKISAFVQWLCVWEQSNRIVIFINDIDACARNDSKST